MIFQRKLARTHAATNDVLGVFRERLAFTLVSTFRKGSFFLKLVLYTDRDAGNCSTVVGEWSDADEVTKEIKINFAGFLNFLYKCCT
jgi:hypothetical protein